MHICFVDFYNFQYYTLRFYFVYLSLLAQPVNITFYPAMTAFTDQYSLPNIFFDIGQL